MAAFTLQTTIFASLVTIVLATIFVYVAARVVIDTSSILASLATVVIGTLVAGVVASFVPGTLGIVLAAATWALAAAVFFRTAWVKGAVVGLVAWALWAGALWVVDRLFG